MKIYILSLVLINSLQAVSIQYTDTAKKDISKIIFQKYDLFNKIKNHKKKIQGSALDNQFNEHLQSLKNNFSNLKIDEKTNKIVYNKAINYKLKGIKKETYIQPYEHLTLNFLNDNFSYGKNEEIKVLNVREEYGAEQEKDKNGIISPNVNIKTYSYDVIVGKKLFDKPIFNAISIIEIDPREKKIISFELENWTPITYSEENYLKELSPEYIMNRIKKTITQKSNNKEEIFKIEGVKIGWVVDKNSKKLIPSFLHYGTISNSSNIINYNIAKEKYSFYFTERLDKTTIIKRQSNDSLASQKSVLHKKLNIENKTIETQGIKDTNINILIDKK